MVLERAAILNDIVIKSNVCHSTADIVAAYDSCI